MDSVFGGAIPSHVESVNRTEDSLSGMVGLFKLEQTVGSAGVGLSFPEEWTRTGARVEIGSSSGISRVGGRVSEPSGSIAASSVVPVWSPGPPKRTELAAANSGPKMQLSGRKSVRQPLTTSTNWELVLSGD